MTEQEIQQVLAKQKRFHFLLLLAVFTAAILTFIITLTLNTDLDAIKQHDVYKLIFSLFILICIVPLTIFFINSLSYFKMTKSHAIFACVFSTICFLIAISIYLSMDIYTVPGGTNNIFEYATTKLYKQHFRYLLIFLFGAACFGQFIYAISLRSKFYAKGKFEIGCQFVLSILWLAMFILNLILSINYSNYTYAVTTFIIDLIAVATMVTIYIIMIIVKLIKSKTNS